MFSCSGYDLALIKRSHTLNYYVFTKVLIKNMILQTRCWLLETVIAQFIAKTTNSEKAISFLSLMSCSIKKLKSVLHIYKILCFPILLGKKKFAPGNGGEGGGGGAWRPPCPPFPTAL